MKKQIKIACHEKGKQIYSNGPVKSQRKTFPILLTLNITVPAWDWRGKKKKSKKSAKQKAGLEVSYKKKKKKTVSTIIWIRNWPHRGCDTVSHYVCTRTKWHLAIHRRRKTECETDRETERWEGGGGAREGGTKCGVFRKVTESVPSQCTITIVAHSLEDHEISRILLGIVEADKNGRVGYVVDGRVEQVDFIRIVCNISRRRLDHFPFSLAEVSNSDHAKEHVPWPNFLMHCAVGLWKFSISCKVVSLPKEGGWVQKSKNTDSLWGGATSLQEMDYDGIANVYTQVSFCFTIYSSLRTT